MPTTLIGLLLFLVLLVPGFAYTLRRERSVSSRSLSTFRETVELAFVSAVANAAALLLFAVVRSVVPSWTPDIPELVRHPAAYTADHLGSLTAWGAGLLATATGFALVAASPRLRRSPREHEAYVSAWTLLFTEHPGSRIYLGCLLDDGSYVTGELYSYSRASDDTENRDLTLSGPIRYRAAGAAEMTVLPDVGAVAISARQLAMLTVAYQLPAEPQPTAPQREAPESPPPQSEPESPDEP